MPTIEVRGQPIEIDVRSELEQFEWERATWTEEKLIAASPFRYDRKPSFFVRLQPYGQYPAGVWSDSGAYDEEWRSGNFVKLLSFLRSETYEETEEYLLMTYGRSSGDDLKLQLNLRLPRRFEPLPESLIEPAISPYLTSRGISEQAQRLAGVGRSRHKGFVAIPWRTARGELANVMYRAVRGKLFFYEKGGWPIRELVWGIDLIYRERAKLAVLCEAPIDALTWWSAGVPAIAVGGVNFSDKQADIIKMSPIETLVLGADNDKAGAKLNEAVKRKMRGYVRLMKVDYGDKKDANECGVDVLRDKAELFTPVFDNLFDWNVKKFTNTINGS